VTLRATLVNRLKDTWHGTPWYGDPSDKILAGITAVEATKKISPDAHSIWQIVLHMTAWTETATARVRGMGSKAPDRGDWPAVGETSDAAWSATLEDLAKVRRELIEEINVTHEEELQLHVKNHNPPFGDTGMSRSGTVLGLIEHDIYHLGQVALIKRAIRSGG
jgi:uncharacterized damage-inducible protein DinB